MAHKRNPFITVLRPKSEKTLKRVVLKFILNLRKYCIDKNSIQKHQQKAFYFFYLMAFEYQC
jgi:hypothetical protein